MKTNSILFHFSLLVFTFSFVGCDLTDQRTLGREREDSIYKNAMADYAAGRAGEAIKGLERVVVATPANASARFQLACLLQDVKKDYLGAICNYREFIAQDSTGEKVQLAKDRIAQCEELLGPVLVKKFDIGGNATLTERNAALTEQVTSLQKSKLDLEKRLERAMVRAEESAKETERMRLMLEGEALEDAERPVIKTEAALLDDLDETDDRIKLSKDVKQLMMEETEERSETPFAVAERKPKAVVEKKPTGPAHEPRPPEYIVQEGDTLYKLAVRFYGMRSAWMKIREANKAIVSTDGRIKVGQKLVLP